MTGLLGFEKEDFTSIVDVGAAVFQLMSELAFYDGSDDASGVHSVEREVGRNKVVSERRKQAIREYYETETEDETRNTDRDESRDSCAEGRRSTTWARQESDLDDYSLSTYETTDAPFLTQRNRPNSVSFGYSKPKQGEEYVVGDENLEDDKPLSKERAGRASAREKQTTSTTANRFVMDFGDAGKNLHLIDAREENEQSNHATTEPKSGQQSKSTKALSMKQVNPKVVVEVKMSSSNDSRRTIDRVLDMEDATTKKQQNLSISKRILMRKAKAKIAKFNAESERSKNEGAFKVIDSKSDQESLEKKSEASSMSNSDVQGSISTKSQSPSSV
ncbi:MAG: hypothetical protein SGILL_005452, partial [Bacillariaceae sp.]